MTLDVSDQTASAQLLVQLGQALSAAGNPVSSTERILMQTAAS